MDDAFAAGNGNLRVIMCLTFDRRAAPQEVEAAKAAIVACPSVLHSVELSGTYDFMFEAEVPDMAAYNAQLATCAEPMARLVARYDNGRMKRIDCTALDKVSAEGDYMRVHSASQSWMLHSTMGALRKRLGCDDFIQLHRSMIVRRGFIDELFHSGRHWTAFLNDGTKERVAKGSVPEMLQMLRMGSTTPGRASSNFSAPDENEA